MEQQELDQLQVWTAESAAERARRGIELADAEWGEWWSDLDPDGLEMNSCQRCVLGQRFWQRMLDDDSFVDPRYPQWSDLVRYVFGDDSVVACAKAVAFGFNSNMSRWQEEIYELEDLWRAEIKARQAAAR